MTHYPQNGSRPSIIDLVFLSIGDQDSVVHCGDFGESDHQPINMFIHFPILEDTLPPRIKKGSEEESGFLLDLVDSISSIPVPSGSAMNDITLIIKHTLPQVPFETPAQPGHRICFNDALPFPPPSPPLALRKPQLSHVSSTTSSPQCSPPSGQCLTRDARHTRPYNTSNSPSRRSIVVIVEASTSVDLLPLEPQLSGFINNSQSSLLVESFHLAYRGLCLTTTSIPSPSNLSRLETFPCTIIPEGSTVHCEIPSSHSFCKLVGIPFPHGGNSITPKDAEVILHSSVYKDSIHLAAPSHRTLHSPTYSDWTPTGLQVFRLDSD